jgi:hypothetical protein
MENTVIAVVTVVVFYVLLSCILSFTWNRSVTKIFNSSPLDWVEGLFLLLTMNILFGTFSQGAFAVYSGYANKVTTKIESL